MIKNLNVYIVLTKKVEVMEKYEVSRRQFKAFAAQEGLDMATALEQIKDDKKLQESFADYIFFEVEDENIELLDEETIYEIESEFDSLGFYGE
jgi:hypothetical protein